MPLGFNRDGGVALWRQIAAFLQRDITDGTYPPGGRLPTEAHLATRFGVNRHTVRRAIEELTRDGLVRVDRGRGTFVAEDVLDYAVEPRTRFSEWIRRHNKEPSGEILQLREIAADAPIAAALGLQTGASAVLLERLGLADARPVSLTRHYFSLRGMLDTLRDQPSITAALKCVGVDNYWRRITRVSARLPTPTEAERLRMPRNRPVLIAENVNVDSVGTVVEFAVGCYPTPRVQIVFEP